VGGALSDFICYILRA